MKNKEIVAVIDIGSNTIKMKIAEITPRGEVKTLELLRRSVPLGKDTFTKGKVSFVTVDKTCDILKGFKQLLKDYNVNTYRVVATSAIREAENKDYILDQIKLKTGLKIDLISNSEERYLTNKAIREKISEYIKFRKQGAMVLDLGTGSIAISIYTDNHLVFSQNIKLGSLRLRQILASIAEKNLDYPQILEEYIESNIDRLEIFKPNYPLKYFIALGGSVQTIKKLLQKNNDNYLQKQIFEKIYNEYINKSYYSLVNKYNISYDKLDILIPSMILLKKFLEKTEADIIYTPPISLRDGIIADFIDNKFNTRRNFEFKEDIIASTRFLASRYSYDKNHAEDVEKKSILIFDSLKRLHGLGERERLLLKLAAILHDIGKYLSFDKHYVHSYNIIMSSSITGISEKELEIIANIARYHSTIVPRYSHENFKKLSDETKVVVAKLVAIIRLADALDRSHKQKISNLKINLKEKELIIKGETKENIALEKWTFDAKSEFFQEVFGIKPILKIKRMIENE